MDTETKEVIARAELPKLFKSIRLALGLSQEKMSQLSGISRVQISYYETADSVPTMATFNKWLDAATKEIKALRGKSPPIVRDKTTRGGWGNMRKRTTWGRDSRK
ncbi:helix-turn-helix domain-containing protein [Chloroflexota bacterium]